MVAILQLLTAQEIDTTVAMESLEPLQEYKETDSEIKFFGDYYLGADQISKENVRVFGVGGLGSVSAHQYKVQTGDRMVQLNAELLLLPNFMEGDHYLSLFFDTGHTWNKSDYSFTDFSSITNSGISAVGIGIGDEDLDWRVNIARALGVKDTWETTFRFNINF